MFDEYEQMYQEAVDGLDVKYIDGIPYMSIHTVDVVNESLVSVVNESAVLAEQGEPHIPEDAIQGMLWVMSVWASLHDELEVRAATQAIPDTIPDDFKE